MYEISTKAAPANMTAWKRRRLIVFEPSFSAIAVKNGSRSSTGT
jgi:hypothetical protein